MDKREVEEVEFDNRNLDTQRKNIIKTSSLFENLMSKKISYTVE
jgi:hypothetical protein